MWLSKTCEFFFDLDFKTFGIFPRNSESLKGIILAPFVHGNFEHLMGNSLPFLFLAGAIFFFYRKMAIRIIFFSWILTGLLVWIGGRYSWHIGASGLIYAFASFLFFSGILSKERQLIAIALLVAFLYGGLIWGIFPADEGVSWESHLFGFLSGFVFAWFFGREYLSIARDKEAEQAEDFTEISVSHKVDIEYNYHEED